MAEPGPGPDRGNQPSRLASMTNWVRSWTTNWWVVGSNPDSNPDRDTENVNRMAVDRGKTVVLAALGRPFSLGMLYDCRNDSLIPALTLWNREALEKEANEKPLPNSDFEIVASDSVKDKSSALDVEASLQASFLCGLVEIGGSAKFLSDSKISSNQARVTLKYKTTTKFKELSMNHIGRGNVEHPYVFESGQATHVVTGILYGAQAFFVFDREVSQKENRQDIEGNLKVLIKKIPTLKIEGQGSLNMADKDIENVDKFSCKFHGDFNLEKSPVSFQEAIEVYQSLPKLLGTNGENAVPQKVWLMPLKALDSAAAQLVRQISDGLIREAQHILEDLSELERRCNDAERCKTAQQFAQVKKKVKAFKELVLQHKINVQNIMARKLPLIRGGGEEEGVLAEILKKVHSSPFQSDKLNEWMDSKGTEIIIISSLIDKMSKMVIVTSRTTLQQEIHSADITHAVCFVFTSLEGPEPYLSALSNYLNETQTDNVSCAYDVEKEQWFSSNDIMDKVQEKVKVFKDFAEANKENKSIRFLTAEMRDNVKKGATLHLYKDGSLANNNFEPPSKPEMIIRDITHNSVTLNISPPRVGLTTVTHYTVGFCVHGDDAWHQQMESKAGDVTVSGLRINEEYQFRCRAWCAVGRGPACEGSPLIKTLPSSPPEKLQVECHSTELSVSWEKPSDVGRGVETKQYILEYAETSLEVNPEEYLWSKPIFTAKLVKVIPGLQPSTRYTVRVRCDCGVSGLGKEESVVVCTKKLSDKLATSIKALSEKIEHGSPSVFKLPLKKNDVGIDGCKMYTFGKDSDKTNRTVMFLGATGSGKSTLINGMINYILGIDWKDSFRFKLINEDQSKSQAESQTTHVITYKINHQEGFKVPYSLTLVDTPGFGDTKGIESDKAILEQIRKLFTSAKGVVDIDAICFVSQASQVRLTATQKYVFDSVLSIFGKDVAENICILVTFADGQQPPVLEAINAAKMPCPKTDKNLPVHHKFNNSALFAENKSFSDRADQDSKSSKYPKEKKMDVNNFDAMFWAMGASSMETFFIALAQMTTKSLQLTNEVLSERKQLEVSVEGIQPQVRAGLAKLEEIRSTQKQIEKHNADIASNENFQFEVEITKPVQLELTKGGEFLTNCQQCCITCHYPCAIADDARKINCIAMKDGKCRVCPGNCVWTVHFNQRYRWDYVKEKQMTTVKELKDKYENATKLKISVEQLIKLQEEEVLNLQDEIMFLMDTSSRCIARLKEIALRPNPLSTPEYIDLLIEGEKSEAKEGYLTRIQSLDKMKGNAQIMVKASKRERLSKSEEKYIEGTKKRTEKKGHGSKLYGWFMGYIDKALGQS
uniref:Fibronectin type-III domain-containing protein n=1 Tax=Gadus morhua TaxID=8049 RepID=A0A8C5BG60_GADMO